MIKKRKRVSNTFDPTSLKSWVEDDRKTVCANNEGASDSPASNGSQLLPMSTDSINAVYLPSVDSEVTETHTVESEERKHLSASQNNLHLFLQPEISKLCDILRLSEDIKSVTGKFLEYIMNNHQVSREPATVLQAFRISLCWTAASLLKQKINRKETLILAKQHLNFECKDEEAELIYSILRKLKKKISRQAENAMESSSTENPERTKDNAEHLVHARDFQLAASDKPELEGEIRENFQSPHCSGQQMSDKHEMVTDSKQVNGSPKYSLKSTGQVEKIHLARMRNLDDKQKDEMAKFNEKNSQMRENMKAKLEKEHKIESPLIRAVHSQISVRSDKLKIVDRNFARKMEELSSRIEKQQKRLEAMQLAARIEEKKRKSHWLEEAKSGRPVAAFSMLPLPDSGLRLEDMESGEQVGVSDGSVEVTPISGPSSEKQDTEVTGTAVPGEAVFAATPKIVQNEAVVAETTQIVQNEAVVVGTPKIVQQAQDPVQLPESEVSTQPPVRDPAGLLDHSIPQPEMQLEHGHLLRDTCSQQVQLQMQPPAEVYAELHNVLQSNTQSQLHTSAESPSSGSGIRLPKTRSLGVVPESHNRPPHTAPVTPRISQPDPLQTELARIRKEDDQVVKIHDDLKTWIISEYQKEIDEIRRKYYTLRQDAETAFVQKRKALETFRNKVYKNLILAEVFRFKCGEPRATGALGLQQGAPPEFVQQLLQMSSQQNSIKI